jgi:tetratricopeptide (TPR) repeat protein
VLTPLETLVEHSLVTVARDRDGETQYHLLEPIRQYAAVRLRESGDEGAARAEHIAYFLAFVERAAPEFHGHDQVLWLGRTEWQADNLRAAMQSALSARDGPSAARLAWALWHPWWNRGQLDEGRRCTEAALRLDLTPVLRNRALIVHATMCASQGDLPTAERSHREALELAEAGDDVTGRAYALVGLGMTLMPADPGLADELLAEALPIAAEIGESWLESLGLIALGTLRVAEGDLQRARQLFANALESTRAREDGMLTCVALINLAQAAVAQHDDAAAESALHECVQLSTGMNSHVNMELIDLLLATTAARRNDWVRCAVLLGCARRCGQLTGTPIHASYLYDPSLLTTTRSAAAAALGPPAFDEAFRRGHAMTLEAAFDFALGK